MATLRVFEKCKYYERCRRFFIENWYKWDHKISEERNEKIINFLLERICYRCKHKYDMNKPLWLRKPFNPKDMYFPFK